MWRCFLAYVAVSGIELSVLAMLVWSEVGMFLGMSWGSVRRVTVRACC